MTRNTLKFIAPVALLVVMLGACTSLTGKTLGENIDDATITAAVKTKLAEERFSTLARIDVDTNQGVVYLNGVVQDSTIMNRAAEVARQVRGVRDVVNNLRVQPS